MPTGTIRSVKLDRGFGFLRQGGSEDDLFFHASQLRGGLEFTDRLLHLDVEFDVVTYEGRDRAVNVRPLEDIPRVRREG